MNKIKRSSKAVLTVISVTMALLLAGFILFVQAASVSQEKAKEIAEMKFNEVKAQTEFIEWERLWTNPEAGVGTPLLVKNINEEPFYWKVPVLLKGKVIGDIEVNMNGNVPRYGGSGCLYSPYYSPKNADNCSSAITMSNAEAKEIAKNITLEYGDAAVSEPVYVFDDAGCCSGEAWMLKIEKDGKIVSRVFVQSGYAYERKEGNASN